MARVQRPANCRPACCTSTGCFTSEEALLHLAASLKQTPAILIHGTHDLVCPPENALKLARAMPHAQLRWIANGGHTPADPAIAQGLRTAIAALRD